MILLPTYKMMDSKHVYLEMWFIEMHRNMGPQISQFVQRIVSKGQALKSGCPKCTIGPIYKTIWKKKTISLISGRPQDVWAQSLARGQAVALDKHL